MFCEKCGKELPENTNFCNDCGESVTAPISIKRKNKFILPIILIILIVIGIFAFGGKGVNSSPEKVAIATIESEYEADIDKMIKCFPEFQLKDIASDRGLSPNASKSEIKSALKEDYRTATVQKVTDASAEVITEYNTENYTIFRELYDYMTDEDYNNIKRIAKVNVSFKIDGEYETDTLICIEMNNKWYFLKTF